MSIPYIQSTMASVRAEDGTFISYPFIDDGDTSTKVYNMVCSQLASDYEANQVELDTPMSSAASAGVIELPFPADNAAFFVGDTGHASKTGGMLSFTRTFANVPKSTTIASGSDNYRFTGIYVPRSVGVEKVVASVSMTSGVKGVTLTTSLPHNLVAGDNINISIDYKVLPSQFTHSAVGNFEVLDTPTNNTCIIDIGHYWPEQVTLKLVGLGQLFEGDNLRQSLNRVVSTQTRYDYILPGVTPGISTPYDIEVPPSFAVVNILTGEEQDQASDVSVEDDLVGITIPGAAEYLEMIENGTYIIMDSSLAKWAGNILVMKTKTCKAR